MSDEIILKINSCYDCPRFKKKKVVHFLMEPGQYAYEYTCNEANRFITPDDGVKPPPKWCPKRRK